MVYFSDFTLLLLWLLIKFRGASRRVSNPFCYYDMCILLNIFILYTYLLNLTVYYFGDSTQLEVVAAELG